MVYFTTYFDKNYLSRGLVLYNSLKEHCEQFELYILCLDIFTFKYFLKNKNLYPEVNILSIIDIEEFDPELKSCKTNRSLIEFYFTLSPCLPLFVLKKFDIPHICSLDADIMFFNSPKKIFRYLDNYSIIITPHNFSPELKSREIYGKFNVSFQLFKNNEKGLSCLEKWRMQCINWCYDKFEDGKFADQKYLDNWIFNKNVYVIDILGFGVAPWNISSYSVNMHGEQLYINNNKLIFYHFHGLRLIGRNIIMHGLNDYHVKMNKKIARYIYKPYIKSLFYYNLNDDSEINRIAINSRSFFKTFLFRKEWVYYKFGRLFRKSWLIELLGDSILGTRNLIRKWQDI